jgi:hypothetical protein
VPKRPFDLVGATPFPHQHAAENLRFIRDTMARATDFTAVLIRAMK